jgi:hypothetical protein
MLRRMLRRISFVVAAVMISVGSASAESVRAVRIPPPPVPGLRNLPALKLPVPGATRTRHVRMRRAPLHRSASYVWVPGHWAPPAGRR